MSYYGHIKLVRFDRQVNSVGIFDLTKVLVLIVTILAITPISSVSFAQTSRYVERLTTQETTRNLEIDNITHDGVDRALSPGEILTITMKGTSGVQASFLLIGDKQTIREISAREIAPGTYQSKIPVSARERVVEGAIVGRLQRGKQVVYSAASDAFTYNRNRASTPKFMVSPAPEDSQPDSDQKPSITPINGNLRPRFTSHRNGEAIDSSGFVLQGQTQPYAEVKITVTSKLSLIGEFIQLKGDRLIDQTVRANCEGIFQLPIPPVNTAPSGLKYLINAVASLNNQTSESTQLTLIQP